MSRRDTMVELARGYDGCTAAERERYLALVGPHETPEVQAGMLGMSGCALFARGLWRLMCVEHEVLVSPYRIGRAVSDVVGIATAKGAWRHARTDALPGRGDVVLVGGDRDRDGGVEHVFVVMDAREDGSDAADLESVDGGQLAGGHQAIRARERAWSIRGGRWWDHAVDVAPRVRAVQGWVDLDALFPPDA